MKISIIMPSLRPELANQRILDFARLKSESSYELIIVSPFRAEGENVVWIEEGAPQGSTYANYKGFHWSTGEFILYTSDYARPREGTFSGMIEMMQGESDLLGAYRIFRSGCEQRQWGCYGKHYACWGFGRKREMENFGGMFDWPYYKSFWNDVDLSMRYWASGGRVKLCPKGGFDLAGDKDAIHTQNWEKYFERDKENFINRWHHVFGEGYSKNWQEFNREL